MIEDLLEIVKANLGRPEPQPLEWTPELVDRFWNGIRATRLTEFNFSRQVGKALILAIEHILPKSGTVLDFGAGDGDLVSLLLERGYKAAGYETAAMQQEALRVRFGADPRFAGVLARDETRQFDTVLMVEVVEHLLDCDLDAVLTRVAGLTKPGGHLVITTPNNEDLSLGMCYDPLSNTLYHKWQHVRSFTSASLAMLLAPYGFNELVTHQIGIDNNLFVPFDPMWGGAAPDIPLPSHIVELRANRPGSFGTQNNLIYIGTRQQ